MQIFMLVDLIRYGRSSPLQGRVGSPFSTFFFLESQLSVAKRILSENPTGCRCIFMWRQPIEFTSEAETVFWSLLVFWIYAVPFYLFISGGLPVGDFAILLITVTYSNTVRLCIRKSQQMTRLRLSSGQYQLFLCFCFFWHSLYQPIRACKRFFFVSFLCIWSFDMVTKVRECTLNNLKINIEAFCSSLL